MHCVKVGMHSHFIPAAGSVLVNGEPAASQFVRTQSAYVPQFDNFIPTMTVREVLTFYARTILPTHYSRESRNNKVESVMETMGLWAQADTLVRALLCCAHCRLSLYGGRPCNCSHVLRLRWCSFFLRVLLCLMSKAADWRYVIRTAFSCTDDLVTNAAVSGLTSGSLIILSGSIMVSGGRRAARRHFSARPERWRA